MESDQDYLFETCLETLQNVAEVSHKMRKDQKEEMINTVSKLREIFNNMKKESIEKEKIIADFKKQPTGGAIIRPTTAPSSTEGKQEILRNRDEHAPNFAKKRTFKIIVKTKVNDSTEKMRKLIKQKVNPTEIKAGVSTFKCGEAMEANK